MGCGDQELPEAPPEVPRFSEKKILTESTRFAGCPKSEAQKETIKKPPTKGSEISFSEEFGNEMSLKHSLSFDDL